MIRIGAIGLLVLMVRRFRAAILDQHRAGLTVRLEEYATIAAIVRVGHRQVTNHHFASVVHRRDDFLLRAHAVKVDVRGQYADVSEFLTVTTVLGEHLRIHEVGRQVEVGHRVLMTLIEHAALVLEVHRGQQGTGTDGDRLAFFQHLLLQRLREAPGRLAEFAGEQGHDGLRKRDVGIGIEDILDAGVRGHHHQRHVADDLRRRRYLDDIAERHVDVRIGARDLVPSAGEPQGRGLLLEVRKLPARHFVQVDL